MLSIEWSNALLGLEKAAVGWKLQRGRVLLLLTAAIAVSSLLVKGRNRTPNLGDKHGPHFTGNRVWFQQLRHCTVTCGLELRTEFSLLVIPLSA